MQIFIAIPQDSHNWDEISIVIVYFELTLKIYTFRNFCERISGIKGATPSRFGLSFFLQGDFITPINVE
jgi:hypothetical protein